MMIRNSKFWLWIIAIVLLSGCHDCRSPHGIPISESLLTATRNSVNYCELVSLAASGDSAAVHNLACLRVFDSPGYDHGEVLIKVIFEIGEERFLASIQGIPAQEKPNLLATLEAGWEYGHFVKVPKGTLQEALPIVIAYLGG